MSLQNEIQQTVIGLVNKHFPDDDKNKKKAQELSSDILKSMADVMSSAEDFALARILPRIKKYLDAHQADGSTFSTNNFLAYLMKNSDKSEKNDPLSD